MTDTRWDHPREIGSLLLGHRYLVRSQSRQNSSADAPARIGALLKLRVPPSAEPLALMSMPIAAAAMWMLTSLIAVFGSQPEIRWNKTARKNWEIKAPAAWPTTYGSNLLPLSWRYRNRRERQNRRLRSEAGNTHPVARRFFSRRCRICLYRSSHRLSQAGERHVRRRKLRFQCLKLALELGGSIEDVIANADKLYAFRQGESSPASQS